MSRKWIVFFLCVLHFFAGASIHHVQSRITSTVASAGRLVTEHPFLSVAVGAGIGAVGGAAWMLRQREQGAQKTLEELHQAAASYEREEDDETLSINSDSFMMSEPSMFELEDMLAPPSAEEIFAINQDLSRTKDELSIACWAFYWREKSTHPVIVECHEVRDGPSGTLRKNIVVKCHSYLVSEPSWYGLLGHRCPLYAVSSQDIDGRELCDLINGVMDGNLSTIRKIRSRWNIKEEEITFQAAMKSKRFFSNLSLKFHFLGLMQG